MNIFDACSKTSQELLEYIKSLSIQDLQQAITQLLDEEGRSEFPRKRFLGATLARSSNIDVLRYIFNQKFEESFSNDIQLLYMICVSQSIYDGQLNTLRYLVEECEYKNEKRLSEKYQYFCKVCALRGNDFCLIYLLNKFPYRTEIDINDGEIIYNASQSKRSFKIIQYLFEKSRFKNQIDFETWNFEYLKHLVEIGDTELLEYVLFQSPFYYQFDNELCKNLAKFRFKVAPLNIYKSRGILYKASKRKY